MVRALDKEFQCVKNVPREVQVRTPPESVILDSMNDFVLIVFFRFIIEIYIYSEIPRSGQKFFLK